MRLPKIRNTTAIGDTDGDGYANYSSELDSVKDYKLWYMYSDMPDSFFNTASFVSNLKNRGYFTDNEERYLAGVARAKKTLYELS